MATYEVKGLIIDPAYLFAMIGEDGVDWDISVAEGLVVANNVILMGSNGIGGAEFLASSTCVDGGNNTGWYFLSVPEILTEAVSEITMNSCIANGNIITRAADDLPITRRGFCYAAGTTAPTVDDETIYEDGNFYVGEYSLFLFGQLLQKTTYTIRSYIISGGTVYYGNSVTFSTYPAVPENLVLTPGEDSISINWDLIPGVYYYTIYWGNSAGITKDSNKMAGVYAPPFVHTSLSGAQTYYYRVTATFGGLESELSAEAYTTITALVTYPAFYPQNWLETEDYIKLLTSQYQLAENFKKWLRYNLGFYNDVMEAANQMNNDFDIDFAVGDQLDVIGTIVGQSRTLPFDPSDGSDPTLDDETFRTLLKAKIALNHWDGKLLSIEQQWVSIFPNTKILIIDNQDMTINVSVLGGISELIQDLIEHDMIIPRPQGVMINYAWSPRSTIYFAYDIDNSEFSGYDTGRWSSTFVEE